MDGGGGDGGDSDGDGGNVTDKRDNKWIVSFMTINHRLCIVTNELAISHFNYKTLISSAINC